MPFIFWGCKVSSFRGFWGGEGYGKEGERMRGGKGTYDIDQNIQRLTLPFLDQLRGIIVRPLRPIIQIPLKSLLAPRAIGGIGNGRVGGDRFIFPRILQELSPYQSNRTPLSLHPAPPLIQKQERERIE